MSEITADDQSINSPAATSTGFAAQRGLRKGLEIAGWIVVLALLSLGLSSVIERAIFIVEAINQPSADPLSVYGPFDVRYYEHYVATIGHLIPALLIVLIGPLQFIRRVRNAYRTLHRWCGRVFLLCGVVGASTGFFIGALYPFLGATGNGFNESMATVALTGYTFFVLARAYVTARQRQFAAHREWMIRSFSIMLGIATERVLLGTLMATTDIGVGEIFGTTFWMAGVIHITAAEAWIRLTRTPGNGLRHWKDLDAQTQ